MNVCTWRIRNACISACTFFKPKTTSDERGLTFVCWLNADRPSYYVSVHQAIKDGMIKDFPPEQLPPFLQKENGNLRIMASCRCGRDGHPALITIWNLPVAPSSLIATVPLKGYVQD